MTASTKVLEESDRGVRGRVYQNLDEAKPQEENTKEAKEFIDSKTQAVADLKKNEPIPTVVVYHHPHHIEKQQSSRQGVAHQHTYALVGNQKDNQSRGTWRPT
jgi:hypothetical protein